MLRSAGCACMQVNAQPVPRAYAGIFVRVFLELKNGF
jgi:hypothetical protein